MNLSSDLRHRWNTAVQPQRPKPVMAWHRELPTAVESQLTDSHDGPLVGEEQQWLPMPLGAPAQQLNRQVHQVQQQLEQTAEALAQLESTLTQLPANQGSSSTTIGQQIETVQQASNQLQNGLQASINHWIHQLSVLETTIRQPQVAGQISHRLQSQITNQSKQAVAAQVASIPAMQSSLTN